MATNTVGNIKVPDNGKVKTGAVGVKGDPVARGEEEASSPGHKHKDGRLARMANSACVP